MKRSLVTAAVAAVLLAGPGCATMFNKETQNLTLNSTPDSAEVEVNGVVLGKTPWTGPVKRAGTQTIIVKKEGYEPHTLRLKGEVSGWVVANALWGLAGLLSTSVDIGGGAGYNYEPDAYHLKLTSLATTTGALRDVDSDSRIKRFVLSFYADLVHDITDGRGEKLDALRQLTGHPDHAAFVQMCRNEMAQAVGADAFAERMIAVRRDRTASARW